MSPVVLRGRQRYVLSRIAVYGHQLHLLIAITSFETHQSDLVMSSDKLWKAIVDLHGLIVIEKENRESVYQEFFEKHPIVFSELGYDAAEPFDKRSRHKLPYDAERNYQPEPDFICGVRRTCELTVFELKTPFQAGATTKRSDGNREKFRASVETHIAQAREYAESIRGREAARAVVCRTLHLPKISSYRLVVVYGLSDASDAASVSRLASDRATPTEILPYDVLLDRLANNFSRQRKDFDPQPGISLCCNIAIAEEQATPRAYVFDLGSTERDRISMYIEAGKLVLECIDTHGETHKFRCPVALNAMHCVLFQVSSSSDGRWISCSIDDEEVNLYQGRMRLEIEPNLHCFKLGCSLNDEEHGRFFLSGKLVLFGKTLGLKDRLVVSAWLKERDHNAERSLEFDGTKSMHRASNGNLIAPTDEARPILRNYSVFPNENQSNRT